MKTCRKRDFRGFTLMEMLIVVAIIAVLIGIVIPVMATQIEKSRETTDATNIRTAYAKILRDALEYPVVDDITVNLIQKQDGWNHEDFGENFGEIGTISGTPKSGGKCVVSYDADNAAVIFTFED